MTNQKKAEIAYELRHEEQDKPCFRKDYDLLSEEEQKADMRRFVAQCMADSRYNRGYRRGRW